MNYLVGLFPKVLAVAWLGISNSLPAFDGDALVSMFRTACAQCHGAGGTVHADVDLVKLSSSGDLGTRPELVRKLVRVLDGGVMPPSGGPQILPEERELAVGHLKAMLPEPAGGSDRIPRTPVRRMNRFQYANAVQDLFGLGVEVFALPERMLRDYGYFRPETGKMPAELKAGSRPLGKSQLIGKRLAGVTPFPQDLRAEHGFDNRADHLSLSPLLLESFLKLSSAIVDSPDFHEETSAAWERFFGPPADGGDLRDALEEGLRGFLTLAFRRPVDERTLSRYATFALERINSGQPYADGMKAAVSAALASPRFLYLYDSSRKAGGNGQLDDFALASRLSFFLWGSIPDRQLLDLAAATASPPSGCSLSASCLPYPTASGSPTSTSQNSAPACT